MKTIMADQHEGRDGSDNCSQYTVSIEDFQRLSDSVAAQGQQLATFITDIMMLTAQGQQLTELLRVVRAHLVSPVVSAKPTTTVLPVLEIPIVSITITIVLRVPELVIVPTVPIPLEMLSLVVPAKISVDAIPALTENNRKWKRGKRLKKTYERTSSLGFEIPITMTIPCVHDSPQALAMVNRFPSILSVVMVPSIFVPHFAC
ncbi:hypothetical protein Scep_016297 [Stephania cephalantha]|uniref:Uncharacterized protein n=1 Tax=Stephania cephalantha TaxID=152367 RepID=A0AAP0IMD0_9MAGN